MTGSTDRNRGAIVAPLHRIGSRFAALVAVFIVIGGASLAAAATGGAGAGRFAATFDAHAGLPLIAPCPALGPAGQKIENQYRGTMTVDGEEYGFNFTLEALFDGAAGLGSSEGRWQLTDPRTADIVARGEIIGVLTGLDPAHLELIGLLMGQADPPSEIDPPDPDMPAQKLVGTVTVSITDGTHVTGAVGDPEGLPGAGLLLPAVRC